ncbi:MAG: UDP-N-acetylglucosamine 2-epimerase (non-hydrolyzing) [Oscillospiraceae bacterium]|jgi:UDP-N-acetylglucosamine 2-epimerase (non-hydrolysing)|nr:UDP-N-acetylglucosamine 2-epimerase (non-hydrolyzing) [Oscillospiraceae bacterium]
MKKLKVMTILGTRPEIIRLSEIIKLCEIDFEHILTHTGQNYDYKLNQVFFEELGLSKPDHYLDVAGGNLGESLGNIISRSYTLLQDIKPDAVLILGDTNSALSAISAKRLKIPIFHVEAGNRCFDENLPEEVNRRIVDHTSDVNLCYSEHARRNLLAEGKPPEYTFVIGSPMTEVLKVHMEAIDNSNILDELNLEKNKFILLSAHREENIDNEKNFLSLMNAINIVAEQYNMPVIYSTHPRSANIIKVRSFVFHKNVRSMEPFGFFPYNKLQKNAFCVVSDSGTLPEETAYMDFPAVCIRTSTERPEAMDKGRFILGGISTESLLQSIDIVVKPRATAPVNDYIDTNVSVKVTGIIQSYTEIINQRVWRK